METFYQVLGLLGAGLIVWFMYRSIRGRPDVFGSENMKKSLLSMGLLSLILIAFVAFLVFMVRHTS